MEQIQSMALPKLPFSDLLYENTLNPFYSSYTQNYPTLADTNTPKQTNNLYSQILPSSYAQTAFMWIKQTHQMSDWHDQLWPSNMHKSFVLDCWPCDVILIIMHQTYINITPQLPLLSLQYNESVSLWPLNATA